MTILQHDDLPTVPADCHRWDLMFEAQRQHWLARSDRGLEVLGFDQGHRVLSHPQLPKGPTFLKRLDALGVVEGPVREHWQRILTTTEGESRKRLRLPLSRLFRPGQIAQLQQAVHDIVAECLDDMTGDDETDLMEALAWRVPSRVYCLLVSAPTELAPEAARMSDSILTPLLTVDVERRQESIDAFLESLEFVREHIAARRLDLGDDFTSAMIRQQQDGLIDEDELVAEGASILQASIDNTAHQTGLVLATLLSRPDVWSRLVADRSLVPAAVEEVIRFEPRFNTIFRHAPDDLVLEGVQVPAGSWIYVSTRIAQRDPQAFDDPHAFRLDRPRTRPLMFGGGGYNCLGQHLARLEMEAVVAGVLDRFPDIAPVAEPRLRHSNAITEVVDLRATLR